MRALVIEEYSIVEIDIPDERGELSHRPSISGPILEKVSGRTGNKSGAGDKPWLEAAGFRPIYRDHEVNHCPGCGGSQWLIGRSTAECAFCATAVPLQHAGFEGVSLGGIYWDCDIFRHGWHTDKFSQH